MTDAPALRESRGIGFVASTWLRSRLAAHELQGETLVEGHVADAANWEGGRGLAIRGQAEDRGISLQ